MQDKAKILIVDDHPIFRKGLKQLINEEPDLEVCGEAEEPSEARKKIKTLQPDMAIIDLTLKDKSGLELLTDIHSEFDIPTLVISMHDESIYAERALKAGSSGYIMKQEMTGSVIKAIRQVLSGNIYASDAVVSRLLGKITDKKTEKKSPMELLSDRELEVLRLIGNGFSRKEIADSLVVSTKTVGTYRENIKKKLKLKNGPELVKFAIEWIGIDNRTV